MNNDDERDYAEEAANAREMRADDEMELRIIEIRPTHPQGFGDHEFEYQQYEDLFKCWKCGAYEVVVRDSATGAISPCPGKTAKSE